ncbi:hypothetical protein Btru_000603 [Bulinus truncatus]|nr:hypothetical protein Btru_000603 [Bulinus truncatus]
MHKMDTGHQLFNEMLKKNASNEAVILTEMIKIKGKESNVTVTSEKLIITSKSKETPGTDLHLNWPDVICVNKGENNSESNTCIIHYIHHNANNILQVKTLEIEETSQQWINVVNYQIKASQRPKKLFVVINPIGGEGKGQQIYNESVEPLLRLAGIETFVVMTERSKQALEIGESTDFSRYDGIVVIGGDGLYQEMIQGLTLKEQKISGKNYNNHEEELSKLTLPVGIIPAGTGNGFAHFINGTKDVKTAALNIIRGEHHRANILAVYNNNKLLCVCSAMFAYGIFSFFAKRSQELRWMKKMRYPVIFMGLLLRKTRFFQAELHYRLYSEKSSEVQERASSSASGWKRHESVNQQYFCLYAPPSELMDKGDHVLVNPFGQHFQLGVGTNCSTFTSFNGLTPYLMGRKISSRPGSLELIDKVTDFKVKIIRENSDSSDTVSDTDARNRELEQILSIDGEMVHLETPEFCIRLQESFVPVYAPNMGRVSTQV